jgi:hypothetical protein
VRGLVPAKLSTLVINTRSMLVLLNADEMVKPPMRSMIVGENIIEKTHLHTGSVSGRGITTTERVARTWWRRVWIIARLCHSE